MLLIMEKHYWNKDLKEVISTQTRMRFILILISFVYANLIIMYYTYISIDN